MLSPLLETEKLILRRYKITDIDMQYNILTDERLHKYISFPDLSKEEELECIKKWIADADTDNHEKWVMELKETSVPIGNITVNNIDSKNNYCNVGYVVMYDYCGNGYAAEALKKVSDSLLYERDYYLVECSCNELNKQSSKVMEKAGFKKDGYIAGRRLNKDGSYSGAEYYSKKRL